MVYCLQQKADVSKMVTVYILNIEKLNLDSVFCGYMKRMPKERQEKIKQIAKRVDKNRSLGAGIILARGLFAYGIDITQTEILKNEHGKPYLKEPEGVFYNLSHSGDYVVGAFADAEVGIDIEHGRKNVDKLVKRCLNEEERQQYLACNSKVQQEDLFLRCWTRKESAAKALGIGLQQEFSKICSDEEGHILVNAGDKLYKYFLREFEIPSKADIMENEAKAVTGKDKYRIAVCAKTADFAPEPVWVELDETI